MALGGLISAPHPGLPWLPHPRSHNNIFSALPSRNELPLPRRRRSAAGIELITAIYKLSEACYTPTETLQQVSKWPLWKSLVTCLLMASHWTQSNPGQLSLCPAYNLCGGKRPSRPWGARPQGWVRGQKQGGREFRVQHQLQAGFKAVSNVSTLQLGDPYAQTFFS